MQNNQNISVYTLTVVKISSMKQQQKIHKSIQKTTITKGIITNNTIVKLLSVR